MSKVDLTLKCLSIGALMLATISLQFGEQIWTPAFPNAKTAENEIMPPSHAEFKGPNASNVMVPTNPNTTENSVGAARLMPKSTHLDWKPRKANHAPICSNALTARATIKLIPTNVRFGDIDSTENGTWKNMPRSVKTGRNQFVLKEMAPLTNDCA